MGGLVTSPRRTVLLTSEASIDTTCHPGPRWRCRKRNSRGRRFSPPHRLPLAKEERRVEADTARGREARRGRPELLDPVAAGSDACVERLRDPSGRRPGVTTVRDILVSILSDTPERPASLPQRLCSAAASSLTVTGVGMAMMTDRGHEGVVGATDGAARTMEDLQFSLGEGPCLDASTQGRPVLQPDLARTAPQRWLGFGPAVLEAGVAAIFAFPLNIGGIRLGVLDLYRDTPGNLDQAEVRVALTYADAASVLLLHLQSQMGPDEGLHPQLVDGVSGRPEVHQATGMISVQAAVGLTEALLLLRAHAFAHDRPIIDVAHDVVQRRLRFADVRGEDDR